MPNTVTLTGWKEFEDKCKRMPEVLLNELDGEVEEASKDWATLAKQAAPVDQGFLRGLISNVKVTRGTWETISAAEHSAWIEWGTKTRVNVPPELQSYASQFRSGRGQGNAKKMIYAWMERVGIPKEFQWRVFFSIITKGIHPHPFFFIQQPIIERSFIAAAQKILNTEH